MPRGDDERRPVTDYVKLPEVSRRLDVSEKTARRMVKSGKLPAVFIGGAYRVSEEDLAEYLDVRSAWESAAKNARHLREAAGAEMWEALSGWRASKQRGEPYAARRSYLDKIGSLLEELSKADGAVGWAYIEAALTTPGGSEASGPSYLREEARKTGDFYAELLELVQRAGLSVHRGDDAAAAKQATADEAAAEHVQSETRPLIRVEELKVA
jgi:excisionase family DNA binding protein